MKTIKYLSFLAVMAFVMMLGGCGSSQSSASSNSEKYVDASDAMMPRETGSIGHIEVSDTDRVGYTSFEDYVVSHTAGVTLDDFGNLVIRGMSTDKGYSKPLILYDGTEVFDTSMIDPYDIASIDVIKDGTSAIYGMRGAGGVIVVTSKAKAAARSNKNADKDKKDKDLQVEINSKVSTKVK